jgi:hypothetical protein
MKRRLGVHPRFAVLSCRLPIVPLVAWQVAGRKEFDRRYSPAIRNMWKLGRYGI